MTFQIWAFFWAVIALIAIAGVAIYIDFKWKIRTPSTYFLLGQVSILFPLCVYTLIIKLLTV
jgi:hypothetical protein